tara:strand:+ start:660 stop:1190 length:531 start_codon:yes stop_codon:yes gene_type:complete
MNRYEFENLISDYLDGSMSFNKQKEFEQYMEQDPNAEDLVKNIRNTISNMNELKQIQVSDDFNDKLLSRVRAERLVINRDKNTLFGFTPFYATVLSCLCVALFVVASQLFNSSENSDLNNNSYHYKTSLKDDQTNNKKINLQNNERLAVDSNIDSVNINEHRKKQTNSKKIKFVNY